MYATHETKPLVEAVQSQCWNHSSGPPYTPGLASQYANRVQRKIWSTIPTILVENAGGLEQGSRCYVTGVIKVTDHSFGSLWVYVICQIIVARERLQLTSWNLASEKYTDERLWLTGKMWHFCCFHGNMNEWIQPTNFTFAQFTQNLLIRFSYKLAHSLL